MAPRGRRSGYQNYPVNDQMLLCTIADKLEPIGRNMWEEVAVMYNDKRSRNSIDRDYDSLRRKFKTPYSSAKPTGSNGELPPKLKPVRYAQEIQVRIERKGGTITCHDGLDGGEDDAHLQQELDEALGTAENDEEEEESDAEENSSLDNSQGSIELSGPTNSRVNSAIARQPNLIDYEESSRLGQVDEHSDVAKRTVGSIVSNGEIFDASLGDDVYGSPAESDYDQGTEQDPDARRVVPADSREDDGNALELITSRCFSPSEAIAQQAHITRGMLSAQSSGVSYFNNEATAIAATSGESNANRSSGGLQPVGPAIRQGLRPLHPRTDKHLQTATAARTVIPRSAENQPLNEISLTAEPPAGVGTYISKPTAAQDQEDRPESKRGVGRPKAKTKISPPDLQQPRRPYAQQRPR